MTGPTGHSKLGASQAHRWTECHGSVQAQEGLPDNSGPEAEEGTALHAVAAWCLENKQDAIEHVDRVFHYNDHDVAKTLWMDEEGAECVQAFLDAVRACVAETDGKLLVEQRFHLAHLHPDFYGTADAVVVDPATEYPLAVFDLKTGKGVVVEVRYGDRINKQLGYYGLGAIGTRAPLGLSLTIVQPRAYHPDGPVRNTWATGEELQELARELVHAAHLTQHQDAARKAGSWCRFCKAAPTCGALREHVYDTACVQWENDVPAIVDTKPRNVDRMPDIVRCLEAADVVEQWISDVRKYAHQLAERGWEIPGWKLVEKRANRKWIDAAAAEKWLFFGQGLAENSIRCYKILSPAQAEKLVPAKDRQELAKLWTKESSGVTLVRDSNSRPAVLPSSTAHWLENDPATLTYGKDTQAND